ncbi:MAG TPA: hypothetical protein VM492_07295, partial [Sumerlaeia bacterium]|nr:hypothetical protein [Sumerlaeia bacterium]
MKKGVITVLAVIFAALACLYYFDYKRLVERQTAEFERSRIAPFEIGDVDSLTIRNALGEFRLEKRP